MRKILRVFVLALLMISMLSSISLAADLRRLMDKFYLAIAEIIERNMDAPEQALREVDSYFRDNQAFIAEIRRETEKAMTHAQAAPMMQGMVDKYKSMSEEELDALEKKGLEDMESRIQAQTTPAMARYNKAMDAFTMKHSQYAMELAMKMLQLMPTSSQQIPMQQMQQGW